LTPPRGSRRDGWGEKRRNCSIRRVKRLLALLAGGLGLRMLLRRSNFYGRSQPASVTEPADELRAKLAETRSDEAPSSNGTDPDVDGRRADVHERARRAIDELRD
jgi:hypothetical protein